jgi:hypothetical protein
VVSHAELATGGEVSGRVLADRLQLRWTPAMTSELTKESSGAAVPAGQLHHFDRSPAAVAGEWRDKLFEGEVEEVERVSADTLAKVEAARLRLL